MSNRCAYLTSDGWVPIENLPERIRSGSSVPIKENGVDVGWLVSGGYGKYIQLTYNWSKVLTCWTKAGPKWSKLVLDWSQFGPQLVPSCSNIGPNLFTSWSQIGPKFVPIWS